MRTSRSRNIPLRASTVERLIRTKCLAPSGPRRKVCVVLVAGCVNTRIRRSGSPVSSSSTLGVIGGETRSRQRVRTVPSTSRSRFAVSPSWTSFGKPCSSLSSFAPHTTYPPPRFCRSLANAASVATTSSISATFSFHSVYSFSVRASSRISMTAAMPRDAPYPGGRACDKRSAGTARPWSRTRPAQGLGRDLRPVMGEVAWSSSRPRVPGRARTRPAGSRTA